MCCQRGEEEHVELGKLESVNVREAWKHEAYDFTPWLAENLGLLSAELGIDLELEGEEVKVGPYYADIIARIPQDGSVVLIENQLERANLQHLGQLLAYLAGLEAKIVIWVASGFHESYLSAIRWLNDHTTDPFSFFAVRVRVVRIGESPFAPVFDVIERPNEWNRTVREITQDGSPTDLGQFRRDFWAHFRKVLPNAPGPAPGFAGSNVYHPVEGVDLRICEYLAQGQVGVYLSKKGSTSDRDINELIARYTDALTRELGGGKLSGSFSGSSSVTLLRIDTRDRNNWDKMAQWLENRRAIYERVLLNGPTTDCD